MKQWTMDDYNQEMARLKAERPTRWGGWRLRKTTYELLYRPYDKNAVGGGYDYPIDLERFNNPVEVLDMIAQVANKLWATDACIAGLVRALDDVLMLQQNLCGFGKPAKLSQQDIKRLVKAS